MPLFARSASVKAQLFGLGQRFGIKVTHQVCQSRVIGGVVCAVYDPITIAMGQGDAPLPAVIMSNGASIGRGFLMTFSRYCQSAVGWDRCYNFR